MSKLLTGVGNGEHHDTAGVAHVHLPVGEGMHAHVCPRHLVHQLLGLGAGNRQHRVHRGHVLVEKNTAITYYIAQLLDTVPVPTAR